MLVQVRGLPVGLPVGADNIYNKEAQLCTVSFGLCLHALIKILFPNRVLPDIYPSNQKCT